MRGKFFKIWENGCKVCAHHFDVHLEARWKKKSTTAFYPIAYIVDVHPYKNILLAHYIMPRKTVKFVQMVPKAHGRVNVCAHRKSKSVQLKKCFEGFLYGMICTCATIFKFFSVPPDGASTEYQISNREFSYFLRTYYCDFLNNVYSYGSFLCCDNGQWVLCPAGIAVPQCRYCFCF